MTETAHTPAEILRAAAAWAWSPRDAEQDLAHLRLVRYPERLGGGVRASQASSSLTAAEVLDHAVDRARAWGASPLTFWTSPGDSPDLEDELRRRGAAHVDTVTVFARAVDEPPIIVPEGITTEIVRTLAHVREMDAVDVPVWEQQPLEADGLRAEHAEIQSALASGEGVRVLARLDGEAVATGGCTIVDGFTRLWGAATLPWARGLGAYRAVLAERLRAGVERGARTALVKGRVSTSAPILRRAGFTQYGEERAYRLDV